MRLPREKSRITVAEAILVPLGMGVIVLLLLAVNGWFGPVS
jgi:hypothetical protein